LDKNFTIAVVIEHDQNGIKPVTFEVLNATRKLSDSVVAYYFSNNAEVDVDPLIQGGADEVKICLNPDFASYTHETYAAALKAEIEKTQPDLVLLSASNNGKELAAEMATRLDVGLATDCVDLELSDGEVVVKRPVFSGKAYSLCRLSGAKPYLITLRPNIFRGAGPEETREGTIIKEDINLPDFTKIVSGLAREVGAELDVTEARIIVSGGLGMQAPENFKMLEDLAEVLGAAVAASRPVVDNGWQEYSHQVGQTGRTVSPDLYIACGISGAVQHLAGMSSSRCIVAINSDPHAAIFSIADYGIVGDALKIVPLLTKEFKNILG
jgi:electron transfer flavoprotein alpha subunit